MNEFLNMSLYFTCPKIVDGIIKFNEQSAGNCISEHFTNHKKVIKNIDIAYYLAGLIEGDGNIVKQGFEIYFNEKDLSNAYYIKKWLGYGSVFKIKNNRMEHRPYKLIIENIKGVEKIWNLINGKFQGPSKINQAIVHSYDKKFNTRILPIDNSSNIINTYWLAGFTDANGNFSIFIPKCYSNDYIGCSCNIIIPFRIDIINPDIIIFNKIKEVILGGYIIKNYKFYRYSTVSCCPLKYSIEYKNGQKIAEKVQQYFEKYHLQNPNQYLSYRYWKKMRKIGRPRIDRKK